MKPTEEQIKKFWEKLGVGLNYADEVIPIDLNNLFKWAVPKVRQSYAELYIRLQFGSCSYCAIYKWDKRYSRKKNFEWLEIGSATRDDPALALFWAIYQVMEAK